MAYFLKKSKLKKGLYLQIYESFYNPEKKDTAHKSYKALGYVDKLKEDGIEDPVTHYREVVKKMNEEVKQKKEKQKVRQIDKSPERYLGFFPVKNIYDSLNISAYLDLLQSSRNFQFSISTLLQALVYSRIIRPCSKRKSLSDVFPRLYGSYDFSYDQVLSGVEFLGCEYEKIIEIINAQMAQKYPPDTKRTYFDCTNFYFEIDKEDSFRRKGPSKENRHDPIVGMGLLLDANQIPIAMKLYPGNNSEKPIIRKTINDLKTRGNITGRTVQVADKGLNSADNIYTTLKEGDGYIFSKSVKLLSDVEKTWLLHDEGYRDITGDDGKLRYRIKECVDNFTYEITRENGKKEKIKLTEKRIVTYNPKLAEKQRHEIRKLTEKAKILKAGKAKKSEYGECSKYVAFSSIDKSGKDTSDKIKVSINQKKIDNDMRLAGYNLIVTSELKMTADDIYHTYHNLWRIEESFRLMKSYLDARPVYLQGENSICGHFLVCYVSVVLLRLLQLKELDGRFSTDSLVNFARDFRVVEAEHGKYLNLTASSKVIRSLAEEFSLPLTNFFLSPSQIKKVLNHKF